MRQMKIQVDMPGTNYLFPTRRLGSLGEAEELAGSSYVFTFGQTKDQSGSI